MKTDLADLVVSRLAEKAASDNLSPIQLVDRLCDEEKRSRLLARRRAAHPRRANGTSTRVGCQSPEVIGSRFFA